MGAPLGGAAKWLLVLGSLFALACGEVKTAPDPGRPTVQVSAPLDGQAVAFDQPFIVTAIVKPPADGTLNRLEIVTSGAVTTSRSLPVGAQGGPVTFELVVPGKGHLGRDRASVELSLVAVATVGSAARMSLPATVQLTVVDRSKPTIEVLFTPEGLSSAPPGFDRAYPPGTPLSISVRAKDPVGGITSIAVLAPAYLGGDRLQTFAPSPESTLEVAYETPQNRDLELLVRAVGAAVEPNVTERTIRIRVGTGGDDRSPPVVEIVAPPGAECGASFVATAVARDDLSGVERVVLRSGALTKTAFGPDPRDPLALRVTATIAVGRGSVGSMIPLEAEATDTSGNRSAPLTVTRPVVHTIPPAFLGLSEGDAEIAPGSVWQAHLLGQEHCTSIAEARVTFDDHLSPPVRAAAAIDSADLDRPVAFEVPEGLCTFGPIDAHVSLAEIGGLVSSTITVARPGHDLLPPRLVISSFLPSDITPGETLEAEVRVTDPETAVRSATVTATAVGLDLPSPLFVAARRWPAESCADRQERRIPVRAVIPTGVRFLSAQGLIRIHAVAEDGAGNRMERTLDVPIVDPLAPELTILTPQPGMVVLPGARLAVRAKAVGAAHDVDFVTISAIGPASVNMARSATVAVGAHSATVAFDLLVFPNARAGEPIHLVLSAQSTANPPTRKTVALDLFVCGPPLVTGVLPSVGPVSGGQRLQLVGRGFAAGRSTFSLDTEMLQNVRVESATIALGTVPLANHSSGLRAIVATNDCAGSRFTSTVAAAYRFAAPPVPRFIHPHPGQTARAGEELSVTVGASGDAVRLASIEASIAGGPRASAPLSGVSGALDALLPVPLPASGSLMLTTTAVDALGQSGTAMTSVSIADPRPLSIEILIDRTIFATGETAGIGVVAEESDGRLLDVTALSAVSTSNPAAVTVPSSERLVAGGAAGTATITATLGALSASVRVAVVQQALVFAHSRLYLSPIPSALGPGTASPEVWLLESGGATDVSGSVQLLCRSSTTATISAGRVIAVGEGNTVLEARRAASPGLVASIPIRVRRRLDVGMREEWAVPGGQRFLGGTIQGTVRTHRPRAALGEWRIEIAPLGQLVISMTGRLDARGAFGSPLGAGGRGGAGAGGGGAATARSGAPGGFGEPSGQSTADDRPGTPGGGGGGDQGAGGRGASASMAASTAGAGGGGSGAGGDGGFGAPDSAAAGGTGRGLSALGGGGGGGGIRGGGGGGGGARVVLAMPDATLTVDGIIDASGGAGGARIGADGTPGGGGGGGAVVISAARILGAGVIRARGGPGGGLSVAAGLARGTGGGGGGGAVFITTGGDSAFLEASIEGGSTAAASGGARSGVTGRSGRVAR